MSPDQNAYRENVETPSVFQTSFLEAMLGELGRLSCLEPPRILLLHIAPTDPLRRIYRLADSRGGTLVESPAGRSFDPSAEGAMTTARPPLSLLICPCLSLLSTDYCLRPCCHTPRRCSFNCENTFLTQRGVGSQPTSDYD